MDHVLLQYVLDPRFPPIHQLEQQQIVKEALDLFRARPRLGFSDCLMLQLARKAGHLPLGTFDGDLGKIEGTQRL